MDIHIHIHTPGPVTIVTSDPGPIVGPILNRLNALEAAVTEPLTTIDEVLAATRAEVDTLTADRAADRAAFDGLATDVRAFLSSLPAAGGTLTDEQAAEAAGILSSLADADADEVAQAADESALAGEVPAGDPTEPAPADPTV